MIAPVTVSGLVNLEVSVPVPTVSFAGGANHETPQMVCLPSGVALNVATALSRLGNSVSLRAITGTDLAGAVVRRHLAGLPGVTVAYTDLPETPLTVALLPAEGDRVILRDAKGGPHAVVDPAGLAASRALVATNIEANHPLVAAARAAGVPVLVDVQALRSVEDPHNLPFCEAAEVLGMSDAALPCDPEDWLRQVGERFPAAAVVLGRGAQGAMLATDRGRRIVSVPARAAGPVRSVVGAGDALWACFVDGYLRGLDPVHSLRRAVVFAGHKVTSVGGTRGLLTAEELDQLI